MIFQKPTKVSDRLRLSVQPALADCIKNLCLEDFDREIIREALEQIRLLSWNDSEFSSRVGESKESARKCFENVIDIREAHVFQLIHNSLNELAHGLTGDERKQIGNSRIDLYSWLLHKLRYMSGLNEHGDHALDEIKSAQITVPSRSMPFQLSTDEELAIRDVTGSLIMNNLMAPGFEFTLRQNGEGLRTVVADTQSPLKPDSQFELRIGASREQALELVANAQGPLNLCDELSFRIAFNSLNEICHGMKLGREDWSGLFCHDKEFLRTILHRLSWEKAMHECATDSI